MLSRVKYLLLQRDCCLLTVSHGATAVYVPMHPGMQTAGPSDTGSGVTKLQAAATDKL